MRRWMALAVVAAVAVAAFAPAAYASHGGAQSPDIEQPDHLCEVRYAGHGRCNVSTDTAKRPVAWFSAHGAAPTADGWHHSVEVKIIDNVNNVVLRNTTYERTIPYAGGWAGWPVPEPLQDAPRPNMPSFGVQAGPDLPGGEGMTTDATCLVEIPVGGGTLRCNFTSGPDDWTLPLPIMVP